ncbi:MAG: hypothetical protein ACOC1K_02140 [Nanoarchaeota archaeon]
MAFIIDIKRIAQLEKEYSDFGISIDTLKTMIESYSKGNASTVTIETLKDLKVLKQNTYPSQQLNS